MTDIERAALDAADAYHRAQAAAGATHALWLTNPRAYDDARCGAQALVERTRLAMAKAMAAVAAAPNAEQVSKGKRGR